MATEGRREAESIRVAAVLDGFQVVLNKGAKDGVRLGETFIIYAIGPEMEDPVTGQNLGPIELVKGRGKVIHLQERMATIRSSEEKPVYSPNPLPVPIFGRPQPVRYEEQPFRDIEVGDVARRI
jgi:hypothetical protein